MFNLKTFFSRKPKTELCGKWHRQWESALKYSGGSETLCFKPDGRFKIILVEFYEGEKFKATERGSYMYSKEEGIVTLIYDGGVLSGHQQGDKETWRDVRITADGLEFKDESKHLWNYTKR